MKIMWLTGYRKACIRSVLCIRARVSTYNVGTHLPAKLRKKKKKRNYLLKLLFNAHCCGCVHNIYYDVARERVTFRTKNPLRAQVWVGR